LKTELEVKAASLNKNAFTAAKSIKHALTVQGNQQKNFVFTPPDTP